MPNKTAISIFYIVTRCDDLVSGLEVRTREIEY